jgi:predicted PurR-regulated permease PerM
MKLTQIAMYILILAALAAGVFFYSWVFKYLIFAVIFAYILNPWVTWLERRHLPRIFGIMIVYLIIGFLITWGVYRVLPVIITQAQNLLALVKNSSQQGEISLLKIPFMQDILTKVDDIDAQAPILNLHYHFIRIINAMNDGLMNIPNLLLNNYQKILEAVSLIATIPLIGFFFLKDNVKFRQDILKMVPNRYFEIAIITMHKVDEIVGRYLRAMFYEIVVVGSLASIVFTILGIDYAILIGFMAGVANIIPYFGPIFGVLFAIMSILLSGSPLILILHVIIGMYIIQVIDNNLVYPFVVGTTINMHPLVVLLTVLAGGWAWGIVGMLVSVPVVYLVYGVMKVLYTNLKEFKML